MELISVQNHLQKVNMRILTSEDRKALEEGDKEHAERMRGFAIRSILNDMKVPSAYRDKRFKNYDNVEMAKKVRNIVDLGYSLVLSGTPGLGKTHLAVASILYMMRRFNDSKPLFLSAPALFVELRDRIRNNVTEKSIIDRYLTVPLLVIDDLGVERKTDSSVETFYSIVDGRSRSNRQLIVTSELSMDEIGEIYGDRLSSRLCGMGEYIRMQGDDYRMKIQQERNV